MWNSESIVAGVGLTWLGQLLPKKSLHLGFVLRAFCVQICLPLLLVSFQCPSAVFGLHCAFTCGSCFLCSANLSAYFAVSTCFLLALACAMQSISARLSLIISISSFHSVCLKETPCQVGCEGGRCTHVLTAPASWRFFACTVVEDIQFRARVVNCAYTRAKLSLKAFSQRLPSTLVLWTFYRVVPWSVPPSPSAKGLLP